MACVGALIPASAKLIELAFTEPRVELIIRELREVSEWLTAGVLGLGLGSLATPQEIDLEKIESIQQNAHTISSRYRTRSTVF